MKSFREYLNESRQNTLEEGSIFSSHGKSPLDLLDSAVKSIKGMIDNLNDIKEIKDFNKEEQRKINKLLQNRKIIDFWEAFKKENADKLLKRLEEDQIKQSAQKNDFFLR